MAKKKQVTKKTAAKTAISQNNTTSSVTPVKPALLAKSQPNAEPGRKPKRGKRPKADAKPQLISAKPLAVRPVAPPAEKSDAAAAANPAIDQEAVQQAQINAQEKVREPAVVEPSNARAKKVVAAPKKQEAPQLTSSVSTQQAVSTVDRRSRRRQWGLKLIRYGVILLVIAVLPAVGLYITERRETAAQTANQRLISAVSQRAVIPADEIPSISTVVDESKIDQQFLKNARKGDKVLLYFQSGQAVVYRPSTGQIVNMGPLDAPKSRVFIRSGAANADTAAITEQITKLQDYTIVSSDTSPQPNYTSTQVIDVSGNRPDVARRLASDLHAKVTDLPAGETRPDADVLIIVGGAGSQQ